MKIKHISALSYKQDGAYCNNIHGETERSYTFLIKNVGHSRMALKFHNNLHESAKCMLDYSSLIPESALSQMLYFSVAPSHSPPFLNCIQLATHYPWDICI